jgi:cytidine deaminase
VAILVLEDGQLIYGANDEAAVSIGGSICAERGAMLQYRLLQTNSSGLSTWPKIIKVYVVTDADVPIPPGTLCREYMLGSPATTADTPVIMQSANTTSEPWISSLGELYPHASPYIKLTVEEQLERGPVLAKAQPPPTVNDLTTFTEADITRVIQAAQTVAQTDDIRDHVHPIRYGVAIMTSSDKSVIHYAAAQRKALEYGSTQDAVAQTLALLWNDKSKEKVSKPNSESSSMLLAQVDQFGVVHTPFAMARSMLVEYGWGNSMYVVLPNMTIVPSRVIAPYVPEWKPDSSS